MSTDANKALARRFIQVWVPGNLGLVDELAAPDITVSYPMLSEPVHGAVALKQILAHSHVGIPDLRVDVEEQIAEGDKVAVRWRVTGTHRGEFMGIPPISKSTTLTGITFYRFKGGRVAEERGEEDTLGLMRQLAVIPARAQAAGRV